MPELKINGGAHSVDVPVGTTLAETLRDELGLTRHEVLGRVLTILSCPGDYPGGNLTFPAGSGVAVGEGPLELAAEVHGNDLRFFWRPAGTDSWQAIDPVLDAGVVSDEGGRGEHGSFTGAFIGLFAFDITGRGQGGDFANFRYTALS